MLLALLAWQEQRFAREVALEMARIDDVATKYAALREEVDAWGYADVVNTSELPVVSTADLEAQLANTTQDLADLDADVLGLREQRAALDQALEAARAAKVEARKRNDATYRRERGRLADRHLLSTRPGWLNWTALGEAIKVASRYDDIPRCDPHPRAASLGDFLGRYPYLVFMIFPLLLLLKKVPPLAAGVRDTLDATLALAFWAAS